jgi:hypothetical protein
MYCKQQIVALVIEQRRIRQRAGRDDARDLAFDRAFRGIRVTDLLADRNRLAELDELGEVLFDGVIGHACHLDRFACGSATRGQRDIEQARSVLRVVEEKLVEVAHAVEDEHVRMLCLDAQVLLHHGRMRRCFG